MVTNRFLAPILPGARAIELLNHPGLLSPCRVHLAGALIRATAAAALAGSIALGASSAVAREVGPFIPQMNFDHPLGAMADYVNATRFADLDGDGDMDAITASPMDDDTQSLRYYMNSGPRESPEFVELTGADNPFDKIELDLIEASERPTGITFADVDSDGDVDLLVAEDKDIPHLTCYLNKGTATNLDFQLAEGDNNPFAGISVDKFAKPCLADLTGDTIPELALVTGDEKVKKLLYFTRGSNGKFTEVTGSASPFSGIIPNKNDDIPTFTDIDTDGDLDLLLTSDDQPVARYFENKGDTGTPDFTEHTGTANPFRMLLEESRSSVSLMDMDGDGDLDLFQSVYLIPVCAYKNIGRASHPEFLIQNNNLNIGPAVSWRNTEIGDIDGDGDLDAIVGSDGPALMLYTNTGSVTLPRFEKAGDADNPFSPVTGQLVKLADMDGDGDLDLISTADDTGYFENTGNRLSPTYEKRTGPDNPVDDFASSYTDVADLDGDGDLDLVGTSDGKICVYENTGETKESPVFDKTTGVVLAEGINQGWPELADIDGDGDQDLLVAELASGAPLHFFVNTGTSTEVKFEERTGAANPFAAIPVHLCTFPTLADMDGDGAPDLFMGWPTGALYYYHNGELKTPDSDTPASETLATAPRPSDSYGPCFIGTATGGAPAFSLTNILAALAGGLSLIGTALFGHPKG